MSLLFRTGIVALFLAASAPPSEDGDTQENFDKNVKPLAGGIGKANLVALYEGLPRNKELRAKELKAKKTKMVGDFPFYDGSIAVKDEDRTQVTALLSNVMSFGRYSGAKLCGGFHPDWYIEWKDGESVYKVLLCFHCEEARLYGPNNELWSDLDKNALKKLVEILRPYRKNSPEVDDDK